MRFLTGGQEGVLINPTSWKGYSPKFKSKILHRTPFKEREDCL